MSGERDVEINYHPNGKISSIDYKVDGQLHSVDGPASIVYMPDGEISSEWYYINGQLHRDTGPAIIFYNEDGTISSVQYYFHGTRTDQKTKSAFKSTAQIKSALLRASGNVSEAVRLLLMDQ